MAYVFDLKPSPQDDRDFLLESIYPDEVSLPEKFELKHLLPVRDQGSQGTCSAQTAACIKEWQEKMDVGFKGYMSPQFIYNLRENYSAEGMTPRDTMKILNQIGIVSEKAYPYGKIENLDPSTMCQCLLTMASKFKIAGYAQIGTIDSLKKALIANGPCYIAFSVYNTNKNDFWKPDFQNQPALGGHAVTVTGWNKKGFIIRNSWGMNWGNLGYTLYPFKDWGMHWECWTALDADSSKEKLNEIVNDKKGFFKKLFSKKIKDVV